MADEIQNANPTILNVSEISRRREKRKVRDYSSKENGGIQSIMMAKPSYAMDPFYLSDFSDEDSDDSGLEPIDEQEIYGKDLEFLHLSPCWLPSNSRYILAIIAYIYNIDTIKYFKYASLSFPSICCFPQCSLELLRISTIDCFSKFA